MQKVLNGPKFKKSIPTDAIRFVAATSEDGQASTMIFDNFLIETGLGNPSVPDVVTRTFTYVREIENAEDCLVEQDFRGFVAREGNASAAMIVHSGSQTTVVDLVMAIEDAKNCAVSKDFPTRKKAQKAAAEEGLNDSERVGEFDDFFVRISTLVPSGQSLQTTIVLLVDRVGEADESTASLTIDSIDSEVKASLDTNN